jgi:hypothetical protein
MRAGTACLTADDVIVSFTNTKADLVETRANAFASRYLLPLEITKQIPVRQWTRAEIVKWASQFKVSTTALAIALKEAGIIDDDGVEDLRQARVPANEKVDPELTNLNETSAIRKQEFLSRGLSAFYVRLCLEAWTKGIVSAGRVAEMLLVDDFELWDIAELFGMRPAVR